MKIFNKIFALLVLVAFVNFAMANSEVEQCVAHKVAELRKEVGSDYVIRYDQLEEWEMQCEFLVGEEYLLTDEEACVAEREEEYQKIFSKTPAPNITKRWESDCKILYGE